MKYVLQCTLLLLTCVCSALAWLCGAILVILCRALPLSLVLVFTVWFLAGCVYQPIHVELYNVTDVSAETIDVGIDASRNTATEVRP